MTDYGPTDNEKVVLPCTHCYHRQPTTYLTYPPQYPEICCHCGNQRVVRPSEPPAPPGHGPYYPRQQPYSLYFTTTGGTHSCSCRPENGGSGICNCTLGGPTITCTNG